MKTLSVLSVLVLALLLFGCASQQAPNQAPGPGPAGAPPSIVGTKFSDWRYYPMAFQIAPGPISAANQAALNVFVVNQTAQADGSVLVTVTDNQDKDVNNLTIQKGQTLYFSDGNPNDDVGNESDSTLMDDHFVVVDGSGIITQALDAP